MKPYPRPHWKKIAEQMRFYLESSGYKVTYGIKSVNIEIDPKRCMPGEIIGIYNPTPKPRWRLWPWGGRE